LNPIWFKNAVGEMNNPVGETVSLMATISGEMSVDDVPLAPWADLQAIKNGDESPMEVVVEVPVGKSKRGWNYKPQALQSIVGEVMSQGLSGFLGHQKAEDVNTQFPTPVTHWVGAKFDPNVENKDSSGKVISKGAAYFRGVIDKAADDLKRWIKSKVVRQVSIFGYPKIKKVSGEIDVVDYKPLSIDWTPLNRPGMPTRIVAMGEIDVINGELDGSHEELREALRKAIHQAMGAGENNWVYIEKVFDDHAIIEYSGPSIETKFFSFPYKVENDEVQLGEKKEVTKKEVYEPVGEINSGGGQEMTLQEILAKLKELGVSPRVIAGEMGWTVQDVAGEMDSQWLKDVTGAQETLNRLKETLGVTGEMDVVQVAGQLAGDINKVREALGVSGEMDIIQVAKDAAQAVQDQRKANFEKLIDDTLKEKVSGEMAQSTVKRMLNIQEGATKEQISGEIDKLLEDETVKSIIGKLHVDKPPVITSGDNGGNQGSQGLRVKRQAI